jgi:uncharacterized metal-binding protein YceD (DUF177 family)
MSDPQAAPHWRIAAETIPERGLTIDHALDVADCALLAQQLDLRALAALRLDGTLAPQGRGFRFVGRLTARLTQTCVVTLEPVEAEIAEDVDVEFRSGEPADAAEAEQAVLDLDEVEPIENGVLNLGRLAFDVLAAGLDPYPRKPGAKLDWQPPAKSSGGAENPFAVLARLKPKA